MKKLILLPFLTLIFVSSSCRKNYSCTCTTNLTEPGYVPYQTATVQKIDGNVTKKKATKICTNTAIQMEANTRLIFNDDVKVETSCSIQENQ
ncbi:MAG: hypothetical protein IPL10_11360 [Bacteroidetes bacterium]|nr:hypothetical protein [Bacteroidota bacterium]